MLRSASRNRSRAFLPSMDLSERLRRRILDGSSAELTAEERAAAIGAFCRRIVNHPGLIPELSVAAMRCLREAPEPTDAALEQLLRALDQPQG